MKEVWGYSDVEGSQTVPDVFVKHESDIIEGLSVGPVGWPWKKSTNT
jgi:hypothetical protein